MTTELLIKFPPIKQGSQPTVTFDWPLPPSHTPTDFTTAVVTATMRQNLTGDVTAVTGVLTVTNGPNRVITWALSDEDCGTAGEFAVTFRAVIGSVPIYSLYAKLTIEENPTVNTTHPPMYVGVPVADAAWLAAARATVPDGTDIIADATTDGLWGRLRASGVGSWLAATTVGAALFAAVDAAAARLAIGAAANAGAGVAGQLATIDAAGNAVRAGILSARILYIQQDGSAYKVVFEHPVSGKQSAIFVDMDGGLVFTSEAVDVLFNLQQVDIENTEGGNTTLRVISPTTDQIPDLHLVQEGSPFIVYHDAGSLYFRYIVSDIVRLNSATGIFEWLGANADANRAAQRASILASPLRPTQTDIAGTTHTFVTSNEGQIVASQSSSATEFTIPLNTSQPFAVGAIVGAEQHGTGTLTIKAVSGVTLNGVDGASKAVTAQWGAVAIRKISTNGWAIIGAI